MKRGSEDIRALAVRSVLSKKFSAKQVAEQTGYTLATIYNWIRIYKKEQRLTPKPSGHRQPVFSESEHEQAKALIQEKPDITLVEIREHIQKKCSLDAVHNLCKRLNLTFKKNDESKRARSSRYYTEAQRMGRISKKYPRKTIYIY